uniref:Uncharacterized protein n=1 Tax=viral metagenome TaxID=1070528 RepID=A0A6C0EDY7_9ZZZZ
MSDVDKYCRAGFFGNFYPSPIVVAPPNYPSDFTSFNNVEAAFQALKDWPNKNLYTSATGYEAVKLKKNVKNPDYTYSGYGSNIIAMFNLLYIKFLQEPFTSGLLNTGDAFLLEHNNNSGKDFIWSNNSIGDGSNALDVLLMHIRDILRVDSTYYPHTDIIQKLTGIKLKLYIDNSNPVSTWISLVQTATNSLSTKPYNMNPIQPQTIPLQLQLFSLPYPTTIRFKQPISVTSKSHFRASPAWASPPIGIISEILTPTVTNYDSTINDIYGKISKIPLHGILYRNLNPNVLDVIGFIKKLFNNKEVTKISASNANAKWQYTIFIEFSTDIDNTNPTDIQNVFQLNNTNNINDVNISTQKGKQNRIYIK